MINFRINNRTHRKLVVIDGPIGYVGGFNVGDEYLGKNPKFGYWRDTHLRVTGTAVSGDPAPVPDRLERRRGARGPRQLAGRVLRRAGRGAGRVALQIAASGPDSSWERIKFGYIKMIDSARRSVWIQSPYFMPDFAVLDALKIAARSGLDVRLMIPDKPDHLLVYPATLSYADELARPARASPSTATVSCTPRPCWSTTRWARSAPPTWTTAASGSTSRSTRSSTTPTWEAGSATSTSTT